MQKLLDEHQNNIVELLAEFANILVILGSEPNDHMFFAFTKFEGTNRTNIGSVEHNEVKGVNITNYIRKNSSLSLIPSHVQSSFMQHVDTKAAVIVKYANLAYLIFST